MKKHSHHILDDRINVFCYCFVFFISCQIAIFDIILLLTPNLLTQLLIIDTFHFHLNSLDIIDFKKKTFMYEVKQLEYPTQKLLA